MFILTSCESVCQLLFTTQLYQGSLSNFLNSVSAPTRHTSLMTQCPLKLQKDPHMSENTSVFVSGLPHFVCFPVPPIYLQISKFLFIFTAKENSIYIRTTFSLFIHQLMDLHVPNVMNIAVTNMDDYATLQQKIESFEYICIEGSTRSHDRSISSLWRKFYTDCSYNSLHSHQQFVRTVPQY